jgi:DNA-binding transcriptional MocR family regulator
MSFEAMTWANAQRTGCPARKALLVAIANYADRDGVCWPSQKRLAHDSEQSLSSVERHMKSLEASGLITRREKARRGDGGVVTEITLCMDVEKIYRDLAENRRRTSTNSTSRQIEGTSDCGSGPVNLEAQVPSNCGDSNQSEKPIKEPTP